MPFPQTPLIALQAAMPLKDMATSTAAFVLIRTIGGTVGISVGQAIISSVCSFIVSISHASNVMSAGTASTCCEDPWSHDRHLSGVVDRPCQANPPPSGTFSASFAHTMGSLTCLSCIAQNIAERVALTHAYTRSISTIWLVNTPVMGVGFFLGTPIPLETKH